MIHAAQRVPSPESLPRSGRSLLKQQAYETLKLRIQDGTYGMGAFLSERQLAQGLGMSKTPVRAALERLENEGFISVGPQQGIVVRGISPQEIADQFELRVVLESHVARNLAGRLTAEGAAVLRQSLSRQQSAIDNGDALLCAKLDADFHLQLCGLLGNQEIERVLAQLRDKMHRLIAQVMRCASGRPTSTLSEHAGIVDSILAGDGAGAAQLMTEHLAFGRQYLLNPSGRS